MTIYKLTKNVYYHYSPVTVNYFTSRELAEKSIPQDKGVWIYDIEEINVLGQDRLSQAISVLEYYADVENWIVDEQGRSIIINKSDLEEFDALLTKELCAGRRAREVIKLMKGII